MGHSNKNNNSVEKRKMLEIEYLTDKNGQQKAVVIPIDFVAKDIAW